MFEQLSFMGKGIAVSLAGLSGTFLVLILIFLAIKAMQKIGKGKGEA